MKSFWNRITIPILCCAIIFPILNIAINYYYNIEGLGITNSITLLAVFITILSTFYSNYKSDERVEKQISKSEEQFKKQLKQNEENLKEQLLFNKKQEIYIKLYNDLNGFWELLDNERIDYYLNNTDYEPEMYVSYSNFSTIHSIMINFKRSPDFLYMPRKIQDITNEFLKYIDMQLEHYEAYGVDDDKSYHEALEILSEIIPALKMEIGLKELNVNLKPIHLVSFNQSHFSTNKML